jgi:hypothetical protein
VGKTHTLKVYLARKTQEGALCTYIDCSSFGSGLGADGSAQNIGIRFFSKFLQVLGDNLLDHVIRLELPSKEREDRLVDLAGELSSQSAPSEVGGKFEYGEVIRLLNLFAKEIGTPRLYIILDEWAQIPIQAQPYFAEFLKRAFFANRTVTMKIGVVDYAYRLADHLGENLIGLEKSADIFSDIRMDSHFVWDLDKVFVENFFAELLYNHLAIELALSFELNKEAKVRAVRTDLFTQDRTFSELCRASEGNSRDFVVVFGRAHSDFLKQTRERVGLPDVHKSAIAWYREDKATGIAAEPHLVKFMEYAVADVISKRHSRTFMVPYQQIDHPILRRLFSARILHPLNTEWSHPDRPGERYSLITVDYGTYAAFKGTKNEPDDAAFWPDDATKDHPKPDDLVPLDDRRSIRRIVITKEMLDKFTAL